MAETRVMNCVDLIFKPSVNGKPLLRFTFEDKHRKLFAIHIDVRDHILSRAQEVGNADVEFLRSRIARWLGLEEHVYRYATNAELYTMLVGRAFQIKWEYEGTSMFAGSRQYPKVESFMVMHAPAPVKLSYDYAADLRDPQADQQANEKGTETLAVEDRKNRPLPTLIKSLISKGISAIFRKAN